MKATHPNANLIHGLNKDQLLIRKGYTEMAVDYWKNNNEDGQQYNLDFFKTELDLINKELNSKN
jgi:hypothetical protein